MARIVTRNLDGTFTQTTTPGTREQVNAVRENLISGGMAIEVSPGKTVPVDTDAKGRENIQGMFSIAAVRIAAGDTATVTTFRGSDNVEYSLTPPEVMALGAGIAARVDAIYKASWVLKDAPGGIPFDPEDPKHWPA